MPIVDDQRDEPLAGRRGAGRLRVDPGLAEPYGPVGDRAEHEANVLRPAEVGVLALQDGADDRPELVAAEWLVRAKGVKHEVGEVLALRGEGLFVSCADDGPRSESLVEAQARRVGTGVDRVGAGRGIIRQALEEETDAAPLHRVLADTLVQGPTDAARRAAGAPGRDEVEQAEVLLGRVGHDGESLEPTAQVIGDVQRRAESFGDRAGQARGQIIDLVAGHAGKPVGQHRLRLGHLETVRGKREIGDGTDPKHLILRRPSQRRRCARSRPGR